MTSANQPDPDTERACDQAAETLPVGDASPCEELIHRSVGAWEERAQEVAQRIARGELEQMIELLLDDDEHRRYEAARDVAKGGQAVIPRIIELAEDPRPRMREMACYILGQVGWPNPNSLGFLIRYPDGIPTLVRHLESDPDEEVRATAAHALGFHEAVSTAPALCRAAEHPSSEIRYAVAHALGSFGECAWETAEDRRSQEAVRKALLRLMDDEDDNVRDWATFGIHQGRHDTPEVRERLWRALDDPNPDVRGEAACALALFGDCGLVARLETLLREDPALSPCYFEAAEELGDPYLLPAVLAGADRWRERMKPGEKIHLMITSAIEALRGVGRSPDNAGPIGGSAAR